MKKILLLYPISNQATRIQPLFRALEKTLLKKVDGVFFTIERDTDKSSHVLKLEIEKLTIPYHLHQDIPKGRSHSLQLAVEFAKERDYDFILVINEGWEDNIEEFSEILKTNSFSNYSILSSVRNPNQKNLGNLFNFLTNLFASALLGTPIYDTKGDSINLYKVSSLPQNDLSKISSALIHLYLLKKVIKNGGHLFFTVVGNGLNSKSYIKLNTFRFIRAIKLLITP